MFADSFATVLRAVGWPLRRSRRYTMRFPVASQIHAALESGAAHVAGERPLVRVDDLVAAQGLPVDERLAANVAPVAELAAVALHVQTKPIEMRKGFVAFGAAV